MADWTPTLHITPVQERDLKGSAWLALRGADYHLFQIKRLIATPAFQTHWEADASLDSKLREQYVEHQRVFDYHLRASFWELTAAFDTALQWINLEFGFGLPEKSVSWDAIRETAATKHEAAWPRARNVLAGIWESSWYFEIRQYRNFAHRSHNFWSRDVGPGGLGGIALLPARKDQPFPLLPNCLEKYREEIDVIRDAFASP